MAVNLRYLKNRDVLKKKEGAIMPLSVTISTVALPYSGFQIGFNLLLWNSICILCYVKAFTRGIERGHVQY